MLSDGAEDDALRSERLRDVKGLIPMVVVLGGIGAVVLWGIARRSTGPPSASPSARDLLDARYARGEIMREQYQRCATT